MAVSPLRSFRKDFDGRWLTSAMVAFYLLSLVATHVLLGKPYSSALQHWGVPAFTSPFLDLQNIVAAIETDHEGGDCRVANPHDPLQRPYNYPRWWLYFEYLGLDQNTLVLYGLGMDLLTLVCALYVLGRIGWVDGLMAGVFLTSPAIVLGFERGNIDLAIFCLLTLAVVLRRFVPAATLVIVLATILKLFPAFGLLALVTPPWRKMLPWLMGATAVVLFYFIVDAQEIRAISLNTGVFNSRSYGSISLADWLGKLHLSYDSSQRSRLVLIGGGAILALGLLMVWKGPRLATPLVSAERELFAFRIGAGIYLGTFALGSNFDYRMIFLMFCLPLLFRLRRGVSPIKTWASAALVFCLLYVTWYFYSDESIRRHLALNQALSWGLLASLIGILTATFLPSRPEPGLASTDLAPQGTLTAESR